MIIKAFSAIYGFFWLRTFLTEYIENNHYFNNPLDTNFRPEEEISTPQIVEITLPEEPLEVLSAFHNALLTYISVIFLMQVILFVDLLLTKTQVLYLPDSDKIFCLFDT